MILGKVCFSGSELRFVPVAVADGYMRVERIGFVLFVFKSYCTLKMVYDALLQKDEVFVRFRFDEEHFFSEGSIAI